MSIDGTRHISWPGRIVAVAGLQRASDVASFVWRRRRGAAHAVVVLLLVPLLMIVLLAILQFSFMMALDQRVQLASRQACRVGTLPIADSAAAEAAVREAAAQSLGQRRLIAAHTLRFVPGLHTGDEVLVEIRVPMRAVVPNFLPLIGNQIREREFFARTVMRRE